MALGMCLPCHAAIVESYSKTGMGRSFNRLTGTARVEDFTRNNRFLHTASQSWFEMEERMGRFYMRRRTSGYVMEKEIHYVLGSGNRARSYVHLTPQGRLLALPVSWYTGAGGRGYWQMAPGFDRPDHPGFRRRIGYDCFFCHNSYPKLPAGADVADPVYEAPLPEGIDCSRCHGPAVEHLRKPARGNILNPKQLPAERQLEVCLQCHLETTSRPLPFSIRRSGRGFFSYDPREPLANYMIHLDHEDTAPWNEKFEVVSAPYRMMQSACFRKSEGRMTCTTCHNPHERPRAEDRACRDCHSAAHKSKVEARQNCVGCHMVKRQPEDAPLTSFTDHKIARRPERRRGRDLPDYAGRVRVYWPPQADALLYETLAEPEASLMLAQGTKSAELYERALQASPRLLSAWRGLALLRFPDLEVTRKGLAACPGDPFLLTLYGEGLRRNRHFPEAEQALRSAIDADADQFEPYLNLGVLMAEQGRFAEAVKMFRQALAIEPANEPAAGNLKLAERGAKGP